MKIYWLLGNPAGFKPNANLAHFLGNFVLSMIRAWNTVTSALTKARQFIVFYIATVGWLGASLQAAALHDLLFLCSFWLLCVYTLFTTIYWYILSMLSTQMKLFRGRKFNTLRNRDDSCSFNVSEMYLGVMVVSISLFLLPTLAIFYYYAFISILLSVMVLQLLLVFLQIIFTDFPYFLLAWSLWQPHILPGGIKVSLSPSTPKNREIKEIRIVALNSNVGSCFYQMGSEFSTLMKGSNSSLPFEIFYSIVRGKSLFGKMMSLLSILGSREDKADKSLGKTTQMSQRQFLKEIASCVLLM